MSLDTAIIGVRQPQAGLEMQVLRSFAELDSFRDEWDRFVEEVGGNIYFSFDWCRASWKHFGLRKALRLFLVRESGRLVGLLPMFIEQIGPWGARVRVARTVATALTLCNPPVRAERAAEVFQAALRSLVDTDGCDAVSFGPCPVTSACIPALRLAVQEEGSCTIVRDRAAGTYTLFELVGSADDYLKSIGKKKRGQLRKYLRDLEADHCIDVRTVDDKTMVAAAFDEFVKLHTAQWNAKGKLGHFGDWPNSLDFNKELVASMAEQGRVLFIEIHVNGRRIASDYGFRFGGVYYWRLAARAIGDEWDKYGLGILGLFEKIKAGIRFGLREIEAGIGRYDYKRDWGGKERELQSIVIARNSYWSKWRTQLVLRMGDALHLLYYRIWFLRLAPKLPLGRRGSLWQSWIRWRL